MGNSVKETLLNCSGKSTHEARYSLCFENLSWRHYCCFIVLICSWLLKTPVQWGCHSSEEQTFRCTLGKGVEPWEGCFCTQHANLIWTMCTISMICPLLLRDYNSMKLLRKTWRPTCSQRIRFAKTVNQRLFFFFFLKAQCSKDRSMLYKLLSSSSSSSGGSGSQYQLGWAGVLWLSEFTTKCGRLHPL